MPPSEDRTSLADHMTEAQLMERVVALAHARSWYVHHCRPARTEKGWRTPVTGDPGFPDLVLARGGVVLFVELKAASGRVTAQQAEWMNELTAYGEPGCDPSHTVEVWRPGDWADIEEMLA